MENFSLKNVLTTSETPRSPRDSREWFPADEIFFIRSMVLPYIDSHDKSKVFPSLAIQLKKDPIKLLQGYIEGLDLRVNWGPKIEGKHISQFRSIAWALLIQLEGRKGAYAS